MKPEQVRFHHIRDRAWRQVWCAKCKRQVNYFHEHHGLDMEATKAAKAGKPLERKDDDRHQGDERSA